jgi:polyphenol oxidase
MIKVNKNKLTFYNFENLDSHPRLMHFITTRPGGISDGSYATLNLAYHVGDTPNCVAANRDRLSATLNVSLDNMVFAQQVHGSKVVIVDETMRGRGAKSFEGGLGSTDAMITNLPNLCLEVLVADCVPTLIYDFHNHAIGIAHAGWRGVASRIVQKTIQSMKETFGSQPENLLVGIGPSIGPNCYEVGQNVRAAFLEANLPVDKVFNSDKDGRMRLDLWMSVRLQLEEIGVRSEAIATSGICTHCKNADFFSYRRERPAGRMAAGIMLLPLS